MDKWRIFVSWLFAALFVLSIVALHGTMRESLSWTCFSLFLLVPAGIHRPKISPMLEKFLNYYWIAVVALVGVIATKLSHLVTRFGPDFVFLCTIAFIAVWIYRDVVFLRSRSVRSGGLHQGVPDQELMPPPLAQVSSILPQICEDFGVPALGVAVTNGQGRLDWISVTGRRKAGDNTSVTVLDKFHLGSCGKSMTATLAALLVEEGRLDWKLRLGECFPGLNMHSEYAPVTLEQLLCHRGGVPSDLSANGLWTSLWKHAGTPTEQRTYLVEQILAAPPKYKPGAEYLYSNAGFAIVGAIIERFLNESWENCMQNLLFRPLGMTSTGFGAPATSGKLDQPLGHVSNAGQSPLPVEPGPNADNPASIAPAGGIHCTLADWSRYAAFHLSGQTQSQAIHLTPATLHKLHTPPDNGTYAFGWIVTERSWAHGLALNHGGSNTMFYAVIWLAPIRNFAVMAVTNMGGDQAFKACDKAISKIISGGRS